MSGEALRVEETEFAGALSRARELSASAAEADATMAALKVREEGRVADAIAFAEVLAPLLAGRLSVQAPVPAATAHAPRAPRAPGPAQARGIADFIDDMLAQDRLGAP